MEKTKECLEERLRENKPERGGEKLYCGYCREELREKYYSSPSGGKYCDKECFRMFTED